MSPGQPFYLTTSIPYVNAAPHLGHALEFVQTDFIARYRRQLGDDVLFMTGADENSLKNVRAAEQQGIPTRELVDRNTRRFTELLEALEISNDDFIRTVSEKHFAGVARIWNAARPEDIYKKTYRGLYCVGCETFYNESELTEDGQCPEHGTRPELVEEENYFFRLSNYAQQLGDLIESGAYRIVPESRRNEVLSFIRMGLQDFSISRSYERARGWGVPVPGDEKQVIYVWYDALGNYVTGLDYGLADDSRFRRYWPARVHCIGKGIIRFHAVYWPAMLLSAGLELPRALFVHGYISLRGKKMSKSLGNIVDPLDVIREFGVEPTRYYLLRHIHPFLDGDFSEDTLAEAYNADLANGIGNLLSRSLTMIAKHREGRIRVAEPGERERQIVAKFAEVFAQYERLMDDYEFQQALQRVWDGVATLDRYINEKAPWSLAKDPARADELDVVLYTLAEGLRMLGSLVYPAMPRTAQEIWRRLGVERAILDVPWAEQQTWGLLRDGMRVDKGAPLFPRLEPRSAES